jgi:hypothetical protein
MHDRVDVGNVPLFETPPRAGISAIAMQPWCSAYIGVLRRLVGLEPPGLSLAILKDSVGRLRVFCVFDPSDREACAWVRRCKQHPPRYWDEAAHDELAR